ncbi:hypothetical protein I3760_05G076700 [Carya illinoinensis]|nr:hypothetical protein I3760_05G076700 [Carya illinoinensis]
MLFQHTPRIHTRVSHLDDQIYRGGTIALPLLCVNSQAWQSLLPIFLNSSVFRTVGLQLCIIVVFFMAVWLS